METVTYSQKTIVNCPSPLKVFSSRKPGINHTCLLMCPGILCSWSKRSSHRSSWVMRLKCNRNAIFKKMIALIWSRLVDFKICNWPLPFKLPFQTGEIKSPSYFPLYTWKTSEMRTWKTHVRWQNSRVLKVSFKFSSSRFRRKLV